MKQIAPKFLLLSVWVALLILAGIPNGVQRLAAAPVAVVTGTEQPTRTPTKTPNTGGTNTPVPTGSTTPNTPTPKSPDKTDLADPSITKSVNVSQARVGDEVVFTITVTNHGPNTAHDVVVTDPFPEYLDVIEATTTRGNVTSNGRTVIVTIGDLPAGDEVTIRIRARVNALAQPPEGRNGVTLSSSTPGDDPSNNSSSASFQIIGDPTATQAPAPPSATPLAPTPLAPTPVPPRQLPRTGAEEGSTLIALLAGIGLLAAATGLVIRRGARK